jgi:thiol-disulfide isomerase/thioredoxin
MYKIVKYRGDNCNPCKVLAPIFEDFKQNNTREDIEFHEVNIAEDEASVERLKIRSIPTIIIFKGDEELDRTSGILMPRQLGERIKYTIEKDL